MQEENQVRKELDKIHKKKITAAEKERSDRLEEARRLIGKKLKEEEEIRLKEEKERKIKANETRELQIEEARSSKETGKENLREIDKTKSEELQKQKKNDQNLKSSG